MQCCPHFSNKMQSCGLSYEGIFLPLGAHVAVYCLTQMFEKCPTFHKYLFFGRFGSQLVSDRRRFSRILFKCKVVLSTDAFVQKATLIDFSQGGMRVVINVNVLPDNTHILFNFGNDFVIPRFHGISRLCWHQTKDNAKNIEAGLNYPIPSRVRKSG